jgi:glucose-6-phosphate 1-epimerase
MTMTITAITDHELPVLRIANELGEALIHLHGAHLVHFQPRGHQPVLWMSGSSYFVDGKPIRGGVPVCGPWFGPHATVATLPAHGLLRQRRWSQLSSRELADGRTEVVLSLTSDAAMHALWPHPFAATLSVVVGASLTMELSLRNTGVAPFLLGEALHTYFSVSDVRTIRLTGLAGVTFLDKVDGGARKVQGPEPLAISAQTDRVYLSANDTVVIDDPGLARTITVSKSGSGATVVWNPWIEKAQAMVDFGDDEWPAMVCVEAANTADSTVVVPPAFTHHLTQVISVARR